VTTFVVLLVLLPVAVLRVHPGPELRRQAGLNRP
jgi:hypothetical protein